MDGTTPGPCISFEIHHLCLSTLQAAHQDALSGLQADLQSAQAAQESQQKQLAEKEADVQQHLQQLAEMQATIKDLQSQLGEWYMRAQVAHCMVMHMLAFLLCFCVHC